MAEAYISNTLVCDDSTNTVAFSDQIKDKNLNKFQSVINTDIYNQISNISGSQNFETSRLVIENHNYSEVPSPNDYDDELIFKGFKHNNALNLNPSNVYSHVIGLGGHMDNPIGKAHELAFNNLGLYIRRGEAGIWFDWKKIATTDELIWSKIADKPTIPTKTSDLTNNSGFITSIPDASTITYGAVKLGKEGVITGSRVYPVQVYASGTSGENAGGLAVKVPWTDTISVYDVFTGAGPNASSGLVPEPRSEHKNEKFLCENGQWVNVAEYVGSSIFDYPAFNTLLKGVNNFTNYYTKTELDTKFTNVNNGTSIVSVPWNKISSKPMAALGTEGLVSLYYNTKQSVAPNGVSNTAGRTYAIQDYISGSLVVNVPWTDTTYTAGTGLNLSNKAFALKTASANEIGGVKSTTYNGTMDSNRTYYVEVDSNGKMRVCVPWTDTISSGGTITSLPWGNITGKPSFAPANAQKNVQADWAEENISSDAYIKNKPSTTSLVNNITENGEFIYYIDSKITGEIATSVKQSDWKETNSNSQSYIKNKPTKVSQLTNDMGYINSVPDASDITYGVVKLGASGTVSGNNVYPVQCYPNSGGLAVRVPWTDTNTTYSAGTGLSLSGTAFSLKTATASEIGGIKLGYTASGKNYPVVLDSNSKAYVNVPWTDTNTTYSVFGPSGSEASVGLVPKPSTTSGNTKFLKESGVWEDPNHIGTSTKQAVHPNNPTSVAGRTYYVQEYIDGTWVVNIPWISDEYKHLGRISDSNNNQNQYIRLNVFEDSDNNIRIGSNMHIVGGELPIRKYGAAIDSSMEVKYKAALDWTSVSYDKTYKVSLHLNFTDNKVYCGDLGQVYKEKPPVVSIPGMTIKHPHYELKDSTLAVGRKDLWLVFWAQRSKELIDYPTYNNNYHAAAGHPVFFSLFYNLSGKTKAEIDALDFEDFLVGIKDYNMIELQLMGNSGSKPHYSDVYPGYIYINTTTNSLNIASGETWLS